MLLLMTVNIQLKHLKLKPFQNTKLLNQVSKYLIFILQNAKQVITNNFWNILRPKRKWKLLFLWPFITGINLGLAIRGPESWYCWYPYYCWYQTNHIWLDKMRFRWKIIGHILARAKKSCLYSDKLDIWIFNKWYKHFVQ